MAKEKDKVTYQYAGSYHLGTITENHGDGSFTVLENNEVLRHKIVEDDIVNVVEEYVEPKEEKEEPE